MQGDISRQQDKRIDVSSIIGPRFCGPQGQQGQGNYQRNEVHILVDTKEQDTDKCGTDNKIDGGKVKKRETDKYGPRNKYGDCESEDC